MAAIEKRLCDKCKSSFSIYDLDLYESQMVCRECEDAMREEEEKERSL